MLKPDNIMKLKIFFLLLVLFSLPLFSQTGEEYYATAYEYYKANDFKNALYNAEKAIAAFEEDDDLVAEYYYALLVAAFSCNASSNFAKAATLLEKGMNNYSEGEDATYATIISTLAQAWQVLGRIKEAEELLLKAIPIYGDNYGEESAEYGKSLTNLATFYFIQKDFNKSETLLLKASDIYKVVYGEEHPYYGGSLNNLATLYRDMGNYSKAEPLYLEVIGIFKKAFGDEDINVADPLNGIGMLYYYTGNFNKAEYYLSRALQIKKKILGESNEDYATGIMNLGVLYNNMGNFSKAEPLLLKAIEIYKKVLGTSDPRYAQSLNNLASLYYSTKKVEKIEPLLLEVLQVYKNAYGEKHHLIATTRQNLAQYYAMTGNYSKAEPLLMESLKYLKEVVGEEHSEYLTVYSNLGVLYYLSDQYGKAEPILKDVLRLRKKVLGEGHPDSFTSMLILGGLYFYAGRIAEVNPLLEQALSLSQKWIKSSFTGLSEVEKSYLAKQFDLYYNFALNTISAKPDAEKKRIYEKLIFRKGLVLNSTVNTKAFVGFSSDSGIKSLYSELLNTKKLISDLYSQTEDQRKSSGYNLDSLEEKSNTIEKELISRSSVYKNFVMIPDYKWEEIKKSLKPDEAIVDLIKFPYFDKKWTELAVFNLNRYAAFITRNDSTTDPVYYEFKDGNRLDTLVIPALNIINQEGSRETSPDPDDDKVIDLNAKPELKPDFYAELFAPLAERLKGIKRIYFSLDGEFYKVNFNTIKNTKTGRYLIEEYEIVYISSPVDLEKTDGKQSLNKTAVLVGYPNYDLTPDSLKDASGASRDVYVNTSTMKKYDLQMLPGTREEAMSTAGILKGNGWEVESLLFDQATESNVKNVSAPGVLSISTHGYFSPSPKADYKESFFMGTETKKASENPMLRSGLFLTGAETFLNSPDDKRSQFSENGILTAFEASQMNLVGTDLVVLSACETGLGEVNNGEGVFGLQRGFLGAGAGSILMSLWKVDDNATKDLMIKFMGKYATGLNKPASLRQAQIELMKEYPQPYYWGAFVLIGR